MNTFIRGLRKYPQLLLGSIIYSLPYSITTLIIGTILFVWLIEGKVFYDPLSYLFAVAIWAVRTLMVSTIVTMPLTMMFAFRLLRFAAGADSDIRTLFRSTMNIKKSGLVASAVAVIATLVIGAVSQLMHRLVPTYGIESVYIAHAAWLLTSLTTILLCSAALIVIVGLALNEGTIPERFVRSLRELRTRKLALAFGITILIGALVSILAAIVITISSAIETPGIVLAAIFVFVISATLVHLIVPILISALASLGTYDPRSTMDKRRQ